jgi:hypothetical protein
MITKMSFNQTAYADASVDGQRSRVMPLGTVFRVRQFCLLGHFLANFSVLTGCGELQRVYGLLSQTIESKQETQLTAT